MVTGVILALLIDPTLAWYKIASIAFIAIAIKNFMIAGPGMLLLTINGAGNTHSSI